MKKIAIAGVAALFLLTGTAFAASTTQKTKTTGGTMSSSTATHSKAKSSKKHGKKHHSKTAATKGS